MAPPSDEIIPHLVVGPTLTLDHSGQPVRLCIHSEGKAIIFTAVAVQFSVKCFILLGCVFHFFLLETCLTDKLVSLSSLYRKTREGRGRIVLLWGSAACILGHSDR